MTLAASHSRYSSLAILLHWAIAALIVANLYYGLQYEAAKGLAKFTILQLHKSIGFTVLALSVLRLLVRLFVGKPPHLPDGMKPWERLAAHLTHWGFYAIMIGMPLTGWIIVSASPTNIPTLLYKKVPFPHLGFIHDLPMEARRALEGQVGEVHELLAWLTIAMLVLHVGAALKHQFVAKDGLLYRMIPLPFLRSGSGV